MDPSGSAYLRYGYQEAPQAIAKDPEIAPLMLSISDAPFSGLGH